MKTFKPKAIYPKNAIKDDPRVPTQIASPPLCTTLVAPRKSGKSALVCGLIDDVYAKVFDEVIIMSDTVLFDKSIQELARITKHKHIYFTDDVSNDSIKEIVEKQKATGSKKSVLLYIDDAADSARSKDLSRELDRLYTKARHFNISIIVCCQSITSQLSRKQKNCSTEWIVFNNNAEDMKQLAKVLSTAYANEKQVHGYLVECTKERYAFCYINLAKSSAKEIYRYANNDVGFQEYFA